MRILPNTVPDLIEMLDEMYPEKCIAPGDSEVMAHRYAGKRELVQHLKGMLEDTEQRALAQTMKA